MENKLILVLITSSVALIASLVATYFSFKANKRIAQIQKDKQILDVLNTQLAQLKIVLDELNGISGFIWNPEKSKESQMKDFIDKTVIDYNVIVQQFRKNYLLLNENEAEKMKIELEIINKKLETLNENNMMDILGDGVSWGKKCIELFSQKYYNLNQEMKKTAYNK